MATILVVDDELGIRALLTEILSDEGHTVEAAEDAASARVLRERLQPDLVLLDIWMPDVHHAAQGVEQRRATDDACDHDVRPRHH
jgi:CheY-like chemotaxis protein